MSENSAHATPIYVGVGEDLEKATATRIDRVVTPGGHPADFSQPAFPVQHRKFGNPIPLGMLSFGFAFFLASVYTLGARGIHTPNVLFPVLLFFGGISQTFVAWFEMAIGNTYSATIFGCYGAWNLSYGAIFVPSFGVLQAYTLKDGTMSPEFNTAMGMYNFAWMILSVFFVLASLRTSVVVLSTLSFASLTFMCFGIYYTAGVDGARIAAGSFAALACFCATLAAMAGFWTSDTTYSFIRIPPGDLSGGDN